jgi:hypothetical protein
MLVARDFATHAVQHFSLDRLSRRRHLIRPGGIYHHTPVKVSVDQHVEPWTSLTS